MRRLDWIMLAVLAAATPSVAQIVERPKPTMQPGALFGPDAYPPAALRIGADGLVAALLQINTDGRVTDCSIETSSGNSDLDAATCRIAVTRLRFQPARDAKGQAVAGDYALRVRWALPPGAAGPVEVTTDPPRNFELAIELTIDAEGRVTGCRAVPAQSDLVTSDLCRLAPIGRKVERGYTRNGRPVGAKIIRSTSTRIVVDP